MNEYLLTVSSQKFWVRPVLLDDRWDIQFWRALSEHSVTDFMAARFSFGSNVPLFDNVLMCGIRAFTCQNAIGFAPYIIGACIDGRRNPTIFKAI